LDFKNEYPQSPALSQPQNFPELQTIVQLADAEPKKHVTVNARLVSFGFEQIKDKMGEKTILKGTIEDHSARMPLRSHRLFADLEKDRVYCFSYAYVHEFPDSSVSLVLTENSRIKEVEVSQEDKLRYVWKPKIGNLKRPNWNVILSGFVARINSTSGLVRRCNTCKQIIYDACPNNCSTGWSWDFRISCDLTDRTGTIRTILARHLAAKILGRSVSEILYAASSPSAGIEQSNKCNQEIESICHTLKPLGDIEVAEIPVDNPSNLKSSGANLFVMDGFNLAYFPKGTTLPKTVEENSVSYRKLEWKNDPQDAKVLRRLLYKILEQKVFQLCNTNFAINGILEIDDPTELFRTERAKLHQGFKIRVQSRGHDILLETIPKCSVLENVWEYVNWRRGMGATARSIEVTLTDRRFSVVVAPSGRLGTIKTVLWDLACKTKASPSDDRNLVEYWSDVYGIAIDPEEIPLLQVQPIESKTSSFTYPPSQVYFDERILPISSSLRKFVSKKSLGLRDRSKVIIETVLSDLAIGGSKFEVTEDTSSCSRDLQNTLLGEIRQRLMGKEISARGEISKLGDTLYFLPNSIFNLPIEADEMTN
jgi:hypothetical protein